MRSRQQREGDGWRQGLSSSKVSWRVRKATARAAVVLKRSSRQRRRRPPRRAWPAYTASGTESCPRRKDAYQATPQPLVQGSVVPEDGQSRALLSPSPRASIPTAELLVRCAALEPPPAPPSCSRAVAATRPAAANCQAPATSTGDAGSEASGGPPRRRQRRRRRRRRSERDGSRSGDSGPDTSSETAITERQRLRARLQRTATAPRCVGPCWRSRRRRGSGVSSGGVRGSGSNRSIIINGRGTEVDVEGRRRAPLSPQQQQQSSSSASGR